MYRHAFAVAGGELRPSNPVPAAVVSARSASAARICERLADILLLVDRFDEARSTAVAGLASLGPEDCLARARLQVLLSVIEYQYGDLDATLVAGDAAEGVIGEPGLEDDQEFVDLWLALQLGPRLDIYGARADTERCDRLIAKARPLVEARASGPAVAFLYKALAQQHLRERRWRVDAQIVDESRQAAGSALAPPPTHLHRFQSFPIAMRAERLRYLFMYHLGMALTWYGDLPEASVAHEQALASAEREGSPVARAAALGGLATTAFRGGDIESVRRLLPEARAAAGTSRPCLANAIALEAWLAWRDGQSEEATALAGKAVELWEPR